MVTQIQLETWEKAERARNVAATDSGAPTEYTPLAAEEAVYTHVGHAAQYGTGRRYGITVRAIILHTTETDSFIGGMHYDARRPQTVSATALCGRDGELGLDVSDVNRPWTTGRWNDESVSLEICGKSAYTEAEWRSRPKQIEAITRWITSMCIRHDLPAVWLGPAEFAEGASRVNQYLKAGTRRGVTDHLDANKAAILLGHDPGKYSHHDVGPGLRAVLNSTIMPEVQRRLSGGTLPDVSGIFIGNPVRIVDTRVGTVHNPNLKTPFAAMQTVRVKPHGYTAADASGVILSLAGLSENHGYLTFWDGSGELPIAGNLNLIPGTIPNNMVWVPLFNGAFSVFSKTVNGVVIDQVGWYWNSPPAGG
jgi:hypothetical protein